MAYNKGLHSSNGNGGNHRARSYLLILLITFGAALLGVMLLHRVRERRIYNLLVKQKDHHLLTLQLLLQKEKERTKELSRKNEDIKAKVYALRSQKMELGRTIVEMQSTLDSLKDEQKMIESAFEEKQKELRRMMQQKGTNLGKGGSELRALRENLKRKEAEIEDLKKHRIVETRVNKTYPVNNIYEHSTIFPDILTANRTVEAQNKTENDDDDKGKEESVKYGGGDDEHITNEDATKSKLSNFKDGGDVRVEMKSEIRNNGELGNKNEDLQDDDGSAGATAKEVKAKVVEDREKKASKEQVQGQLSGEKRKHGHLSRTKGKRWRSIVKNKLMENNGMFESQGEVNMGNRKVYRDDKDEPKDTTVGRDSDVKFLTRQNQVRDSGTGNHENEKDDNNTTVKKTDPLVTTNETNIYPEKDSRLHEISNSEEQEEGLVQQNWSRRRINNAGQTISNILDEEHEELEVSDVQNQEKDAIDVGDDDEEDDNNDDIFKESHSEFDDEKVEYKEELDESEFQHGL